MTCIRYGERSEERKKIGLIMSGVLKSELRMRGMSEITKGFESNEELGCYKAPKIRMFDSKQTVKKIEERIRTLQIHKMTKSRN
jgi:hypothetical protein